MAESFLSTNSGEFIQWMKFNVKIIFYISIFILLLSLLISSLGSMIPEKYMMRDLYRKCKMLENSGYKYDYRNCGCEKCRAAILKMKMIESFENVAKYQERSMTRYDMAELLAPYDENKNPENLFFGKANRIVYVKDNKHIYNLEIYCNLFVLDGNIFDKAEFNSINQHYKVYLTKKDATKFYVGNLYKDGDGVYKIKYIKDNAVELMKYNRIEIVYSLDNNEQLLLEGKF